MIKPSRKAKRTPIRSPKKPASDLIDWTTISLGGSSTRAAAASASEVSTSAAAAAVAGSNAEAAPAVSGKAAVVQQPAQSSAPGVPAPISFGVSSTAAKEGGVPNWQSTYQRAHGKDPALHYQSIIFMQHGAIRTKSHEELRWEEPAAEAEAAAPALNDRADKALLTALYSKHDAAKLPNIDAIFARRPTQAERDKMWKDLERKHPAFFGTKPFATQEVLNDRVRKEVRKVRKSPDRSVHIPAAKPGRPSSPIVDPPCAALPPQQSYSTAELCERAAHVRSLRSMKPFEIPSHLARLVDRLRQFVLQYSSQAPRCDYSGVISELTQAENAVADACFGTQDVSNLDALLTCRDAARVHIKSLLDECNNTHGFIVSRDSMLKSMLKDFTQLLSSARRNDDAPDRERLSALYAAHCGNTKNPVHDDRIDELLKKHQTTQERENMWKGLETMYPLFFCSLEEMRHNSELLMSEDYSVQIDATVKFRKLTMNGIFVCNPFDRQN